MSGGEVLALRLEPEQLELLAELVADRIAERSSVRSAALVGVKEVAQRLGVDPAFVYEHAAELGARRLGSGSRPRLRFDLREVDERLTACSASRESSALDAASGAASRRRRRQRLGTGVDLLPIRGVSA